MLAQGDVRLDGQPISGTTVLRSGAHLTTGKGEVAVQFGEASGFVLAAGSGLEIARFDDQAVELRLTGELGVEVSHRAPGQRFAVIAGTRSVEVRGTIFRVLARGGALDVACTRGRVAVVEGGDAVEVPAGDLLAAPAAPGLAGLSPRPMSDAEAGAVSDRVRVPFVAGWGDVGGVAAHSALVTVTGPVGAAVRIDGVGAGAAPLTVRTTAGRHLLEAGAVSRWLEIDAGATTVTRLDAPPPSSERPSQLEQQLEAQRNRIVRCGDRARKVDPDFSGSIEVEIGIGADGAVGFVAPVKGVADREVEECILSALRDQLTFPAGSKATLRKTISY